MLSGKLRAWLRRQHDQHKACVYETLAEYWKYHKGLNKKQFFKAAFSRRFWGWWLLLAIIIALSVALSVYHDRIALAIRPVAQQIRNTRGTWVVPIIALIVVSVPPLLGHEILILVVGIIWDLWLGFAIACAGTFLGEILCYYLFKYTCRERAKKIEDKSPLYAGLANIMRRDGLWMISLVRFSALPGHITTAIQSTIGISVWIFGIACAISLPKQLVLVYLGVLFGKSQETDGHDLTPEQQAKKRTHTMVTWTVLMLTGFLTVVAMYVIWFRMWQVKKAAEAAKQAEAPADKETISMDENMRYTLPYHTGTGSSESIKGESTTALLAPTIHSHTGKPTLGRSRSNTLTSLALSGNSLSYLSYTPMLEMPRNGFQSLPSPVPSAVVSVPAVEEGSTSDYFSHYISAAGASSQSASQARAKPQNASANEANFRLRRMQMERSGSDMILPADGKYMHQAESDSESFEAQFPPEMLVRSVTPLDRVASPAGRTRAQSRASSYLSATSTIHEHQYPR